MKTPRFKELLKVAVATTLAVGLFAGTLLGANHLVLQAATNGETYLPAAVYAVAIPTNPVEAAGGVESPNFTIIDTTMVDRFEVPPHALSLEEAAQIGAQYIYDIFGATIGGMYVELSFANWEHMTRPTWQGTVASFDRDTLARSARLNEIAEEFMAQVQNYNDGRRDCWDALNDARREFDQKASAYRYIPGYFNFIIDANTGARIDIWRGTSATSVGVTTGQAIAIDEYIRNHWNDDWAAAAFFSPPISYEDQEAFSQLALEYAQRHFNNSAVVDVQFEGAFANFVYNYGDIKRYIVVSLSATDDTGRVANLVFSQSTHELHTISTMRNDVLPGGHTEMRIVTDDDGTKWMYTRDASDYYGENIRREPVEPDEDGNIRMRRVVIVE